MTPHFVEVTITVQVVLTRTITTLGAMPILVASQRDCHALLIFVCDIDDTSQFVVIAVVEEFSFVILGAHVTSAAMFAEELMHMYSEVLV